MLFLFETGALVLFTCFSLSFVGTSVDVKEVMHLQKENNLAHFVSPSLRLLALPKNEFFTAQVNILGCLLKFECPATDFWVRHWSAAKSVTCVVTVITHN
jgi:hypothetical protein